MVGFPLPRLIDGNETKFVGCKQVRSMNAFVMLVCNLVLFFLLDTFFKLDPNLTWQDWNKAEQLFSDLFQRRGFRWDPLWVLILAKFSGVIYQH